MLVHEDVSAAREHIAQIRESKGLSRDGNEDPSNPGPNVADLEGALNLLSNDIYNSCTHFLLELVQNADDNTYDIAEPTLDLKLDGNFFRVDCNERGFTPANVEAICRAHASTKRGADSGLEYIGEKGIGFKSVFQAATTVWVSSRHYSFKFDKTRRLGKIAPIWERLPVPPKPGCTTFLLQLDETYNIATLRWELEQLDSRLLIFLRKLKRINISITEGDAEETTKVLTRCDIKNDVGSIVRLGEDAQMLDYIVISYVVTDLPDVEKRSGVTCSTILLAFPVTEEGQPSIVNQKVYSFLPIRDFGLRFLLHADFLLTTSREDIDNSSSWSKRLREGCVDAFISAIQCLHNTSLRFTWVRYLPPKSPQGDFFDDFSEMLYDRLASTKVLEDSKGVLLTPGELTYTPRAYQDSYGRPLVAVADHLGNDLSFHYQNNDYEQFRALGISCVTREKFLVFLDMFINKRTDQFQALERAWHVQLAEVLIPVVRAEYIVVIRRLRLIPLSDGTWVRASDGQIFFNTVGDDWPVPAGLGLSIVEQGAAAHPTRRTLFTLLGTIQLDTQKLWAQIIQEHETSINSGSDISCAALLSQISFLFLSGWENWQKKRLWLKTAAGTCAQGHLLYRESQKPYSATYFFGERDGSMFVHADFVSAFPDRSEEWLQWLCKNIGVEELPRVVAKPAETSFTLHPHMECMIESSNPLDVLLFLKEYWNHVSRWVVSQDPEDSFSDAEHSRRQIRERIGRMKAKCLDGEMVELSRTSLSQPHCSPEDFLVDFVLDIPDSDDPSWKFLRHFGAGRKRNLRTYVNALENLSGTDTTLDRVIYILDQIAKSYSEDEMLVRSMFRSRPVVFIPSVRGSLSQWKMLDECVWDGPDFLRETTTLKNIYSSHENLFCKGLGLQRASTAHIIREIKNFKAGDALQYIREVFLHLESCLDKPGASDDVRSLRGLRIWPIRSTGSVKEYDYFSAGEGDSVNWFIADRKHLATAFTSKVPLLAFSVDDVARMEKVLHTVDMVSNRLLTAVTKSFATTSSHHTPQENFTRTLRGKAGFILRLMSQKDLSRASYWSKLLRTLQVFTCAMVTQEWSLQYQCITVKGLSDAGHVALVEGKDSLRIILSQNTFGNTLSRRELSSSLCKFFSIPEARASYLPDILSEDDHGTLRKLLELYGVPQLSAEHEKSLNEFLPGSSSTVKEEYRELPREETKVGERQVPGKSEKFERLSGPGTTFAKSKTSSSKHSEVLIIQGEFEEHEDHIHITRHVGSSGCKPSGQSVMDKVQQRGGAIFARMLQNILHPEPNGASTAVEYPMNNGPTMKSPTFTFQDIDGRFTNWLVKRQCSTAMELESGLAAYHILVITTVRGLYAEFSLENEELELARQYSEFYSDPEACPEKVFILIRLYDIDEKPAMALYIDPWNAYLDGQLRIEARSRYSCNVLKT